MLKLLTFLTLSVPPLSPCQGAIVEFAKHEVISDITVTLTELLPCVTDSMWSHSLSETVFQVGDISPLSIRNLGLKNWSQVQGYWVANLEFISSLPDSKTSTRLFPIPYGVPGAATNAHVSSWFPPRMKSPWFSPTWVQRKLLKLINYFDDSHRTSGSPFLPCFMAGKNRWGKGIKGELDFLVQGITAYYKSKHSVLCLSLNPLWFSALCHSDMKWAEPGPDCIFMFPLENVWRRTINCSPPPPGGLFLAGDRPGLLGWCHSSAIVWCHLIFV